MLEKQDETIFKLEEIRSDIVLEMKTPRRGGRLAECKS
jgi:hypothetical protein